MMKNAYLLAKIGADTAENEGKFAKNWQLPLRVHYPITQKSTFSKLFMYFFPQKLEKKLEQI